MRRIVLFVMSLFLSLPLSLVVAAPVQSAADTITITELLPDPASPQTDAQNEFIELFNSSSEAVTLTGYTIQIKSVTAANATTRPLPEVSIPAGGYLVVTSSQAGFALSNSGATVSLLGADGAVSGASVTYPKAVTGAAWALGPAGWSWTVVPTSGSANTIVAPTPVPVKTTSATGSSSASIASYQATASASETSLSPSGPQNYGALMLTELFPDPASPQTDAADEYIEFYNAGSTPIDLTGIIVKTGTALGTKHALKGGSIDPGAYIALKITDTKVSLSNSGSSIALFSPEGEPIGATVTFPKATAGSAWARDGENWSWTTTPTPGTANHLTVKAGTSKLDASAQPSGKSFASATGLAPAASKAAALAKSAGEAAASPSASWLIFTLLGLTLVYCIYEFRYDLQRIYHRLRGHSSVGGQSGTLPEGRSRLGIGQRLRWWQNHLRPRFGHRLAFWRRSRQPDLRDQPGLSFEA